MRQGFSNVVPILDNKSELDLLLKDFDLKFKVGIRIAAEEEPKFDFYTSRLGIRYNDIIPYYTKHISANPMVELKMLHFLSIPELRILLITGMNLTKQLIYIVN